MVCNSMEAEFNAEIAAARKAYFRAADEALDKLRRQIGEGPEGLRRALNRQSKNVDNFGGIRPDKD